jgi:tetratricopeptide (TPR) repeat protein
MEALLNQAAIYLGEIADYPGGAEMARASWELKTARLPESDREVAIAEATLGVALLHLGDLAAAEGHLARALALDEAHGPGSADLADSYDLHGVVLVDQARGGAAELLPQARRRQQQALALRRRLFGRGSEPVAQSLNNLGEVRSAQGCAAAAARLFRASLHIRRAVLPPEDARVAIGLINTGAMWLSSGAPGRAEPMLREALDLWQAVHAERPRHPDTRNAADWLISCLLVRARAGEDTAEHEDEARRLCDRYGFDFAERQAIARQYPYTPGA